MCVGALGVSLSVFSIILSSLATIAVFRHVKPVMILDRCMFAVTRPVR